MLTVKCDICKEHGRDTNFTSMLIGANPKAALQEIGASMAKHLEAIHPDEIKKIMETTVRLHAVMAMTRFSSEDESYNDEMEDNRSKVLEEVMRGVPEDDEDIEDEDDDDDDLDYEDDENDRLKAM